MSRCQSSPRACRISPAPVKTYLTEEILPLAFMFLKSNLTFCMNPGRLDELRLHQQRAANSCQQQGDSNPQAAVVKLFNSPEPFSSKASLCISLPGIVAVGHNECHSPADSSAGAKTETTLSTGGDRLRRSEERITEKKKQERNMQRDGTDGRGHCGVPSLYQLQYNCLHLHWTVRYFNCH